MYLYPFALMCLVKWNIQKCIIGAVDLYMFPLGRAVSEMVG